MKLIKMPVNTYYFLLKSVPCTEPLLIPCHSVTNDDAAEQYMWARDYWTDRGWAELDFDGSLHLYPEFARYVYNISHMDAVLRWGKQHQTEYWIKGPVDVLYVKETAGEVELSLIANSALLRQLKNELSVKPSGVISAKHMKSGKTVGGEFLLEHTFSEDRITPEPLLTDCIILFYGGIENA